MARPRPLALLIAAPLMLLGCGGRGDPAANNAAEADNRAVADLLDVPDNRLAASGGRGAAPPREEAAAAREAGPPSGAPPRPRDRLARRSGERG